jgi:hypothetical protein
MTDGERFLTLMDRRPVESRADFRLFRTERTQPDVPYTGCLHYMRRLGGACGVPPARRGGA